MIHFRFSSLVRHYLKCEIWSPCPITIWKVGWTTKAATRRSFFCKRGRYVKLWNRKTLCSIFNGSTHLHKILWQVLNFWIYLSKKELLQKLGTDSAACQLIFENWKQWDRDQIIDIFRSVSDFIYKLNRYSKVLVFPKVLQGNVLLKISILEHKNDIYEVCTDPTIH